jgi:hypothetical protein
LTKEIVLRFFITAVALGMGSPASVAAQDAAACSVYADAAVSTAAEAAFFGCDLGGFRWSKDHGVHYDFCMAQGPNGGATINAETNQRFRDLAQCWAPGNDITPPLAETPYEGKLQTFALTLETVCKNYADFSSQQSGFHRELGCDMVAADARWTLSFDQHLEDCLSGFQVANPGRVMATVIGERAWVIKECQVAAASAQPAIAPTPDPGPSHRVVSDVDLYDLPGQSVIGMLRTNERVAAVCHEDGWCEILQRGWAWGEFITTE